MSKPFKRGLTIHRVKGHSQVAYTSYETVGKGGKIDWRDYLTGKPIFDMTDAGAPWRDGLPEGLTGERELPTSPLTDESED